MTDINADLQRIFDDRLARFSPPTPGASGRRSIAGRRRARRLALTLAVFLVGSGVASAGVLVYQEEWGSVAHSVDEHAIRTEIAETEANIPLPGGQAYPDVFPYYAAPNNFARYVGVQRVQGYAMCAWSRDWLDGHALNDQQRMAEAARVIEQFPMWQNIADPRLAGDSIRDQIRTVVAAVSAGDAKPVELLVQAACGEWIDQHSR